MSKHTKDGHQQVLLDRGNMGGEGRKETEIFPFSLYFEFFTL